MTKSTGTQVQPKKIQIAGHLDYVHEGYVCGWAYNPAKPLDRATVVIISDGKIVAQGLADEFRQDLLTAGIGDGKHHFKLKLSYELYDENVHTLTASNLTTNSILNGSPLTFGPEPSNKPYPLILRDEGESLLEEILKSLTRQLTPKKKENITEAYRLGATLQETERVAEARYVWESLIKATTPNALCLCKIAETHLLSGDIQLALDAYRSAAAIDLMFSWAHLGISTCHRLQDNIEQSENALEFALGAQPARTTVANHIKRSEALLLPAKIEKLLRNNQPKDAINALMLKLLAQPAHPYALEKIKSILADDIHHSGSKSTESLLIDHYGSMRLLNSVITAISNSPQNKFIS